VPENTVSWFHWRGSYGSLSIFVGPNLSGMIYGLRDHSRLAICDHSCVERSLQIAHTGVAELRAPAAALYTRIGKSLSEHIKQ
jgi:hypothetical protein